MLDVEEALIVYFVVKGQKGGVLKVDISQNTKLIKDGGECYNEVDLIGSRLRGKERNGNN